MWWCMLRRIFAFLARQTTVIHSCFRKFEGQPLLQRFGLQPRRLSAHLISTTHSNDLHSKYGAFFSYYNPWFVFSTARRLAIANSSGIVCTKNYRTTRYYYRPYLWESFIRGRQASRQKWIVSLCRLAAHTYDGHSHFADAKHRPALTSSDAVGVNNATSQSLTDRLTREHRMTVDEARMILNVRPLDSVDIIAQVRYSMSFSSILFSTAVQIPVVFERYHYIGQTRRLHYRSALLCLREALVLTCIPSVLTNTPSRDSTSS